MSNTNSGGQSDEVARVICASIARVQGSVMDQLFEVRNRLCISSDPLVRSALLYSSGWFAFWAEGDVEAVRKAMLRAALDRRNDRQTVIHNSRGAPTLSEPLAVVTTQGTDGARGFEQRVRRFRQEMERGVSLEPSQVWRCLVAPCIVPMDREPARLPDRHVALVSAEDNGPIDLLRKLGERVGSRVVYQRFASSKSHSTDVGLAYVDIHKAQRVTRIHLLSRRALGLQIVRVSLEGLDQLVMLMGKRPATAIDLAASVADCVKSLARPPALCQVTEREEIAATIGAVLHRGRALDSELDLAQIRESQLEDFLLGPGLPAAPALRFANV
ncbi:MAG: hypothetical protein ABIR26_10195 [Ramlibacter sp.]